MPRIAESITGYIGVDDTPVPSDFTYDPDDPDALTIDFHLNEEEAITWLLSIELFEQAQKLYNHVFGYEHTVTVMYNHSGDGRDDTVSICLRSRDGEAVINFYKEELQPFIDDALEQRTDEVQAVVREAMHASIAKLPQSP